MQTDGKQKDHGIETNAFATNIPIQARRTIVSWSTSNYACLACRGYDYAGVHIYIGTEREFASGTTLTTIPKCTMPNTPRVDVVSAISGLVQRRR